MSPFDSLLSNFHPVYTNENVYSRFASLHLVLSLPFGSERFGGGCVGIWHASKSAPAKSIFTCTESRMKVSPIIMSKGELNSVWCSAVEWYHVEITMEKVGVWFQRSLQVVSLPSWFSLCSHNVVYSSDEIINELCWNCNVRNEPSYIHSPFSCLWKWTMLMRMNSDFIWTVLHSCCISV